MTRSSNLACRAALSFAACRRLHWRFHLNLTATGASPQTASRHFGHWRNACPSTTFCLTSGGDMAFRAFLQRLGYDVKRVPDQYFPSADGLTLASRATGGAEEPVATYGTPASPEVVLTRVTANRVHINHSLGMAVAYRAGQRLGQGLLRLAGLSVTLPPHHHATSLPASAGVALNRVRLLTVFRVMEAIRLNSITSNGAVSGWFRWRESVVRGIPVFSAAAETLRLAPSRALLTFSATCLLYSRVFIWFILLTK